MLSKYLDDLESRIDPAVEDDLLEQWFRFIEARFRGEIFSPRRLYTSAPGLGWPKVLVNDALEDYDRMALQQLASCSDMLARGTGELLAVRANYGTAILPSLFGAELFVMEREMDTLPTSRPLAGGATAMQRLVEQDIPPVEAGLGARVLEMGRYFTTLFKDYPKISRYVTVYHPDIQGPMDVCELLWGSGLFLDVVDHPDLVKALLDLITHTYIKFMQTWLCIQPPAGLYGIHWAMMHKGRIMLRDDSAMNFSPSMFEEFIEPYDQRLLDEFEGGAVHFCGKGSHYIHRLGGLRGLFAVHLSQPEYNDMELICQHTVDRGIPLIGLSRQAAGAALQRGRDLHGRVHVYD